MEEHRVATKQMVIDMDSHVMEPPDLWQNYLERLARAGLSREPDVQVLMFQP